MAVINGQAYASDIRVLGAAPDKQRINILTAGSPNHYMWQEIPAVNPADTLWLTRPTQTPSAITLKAQYLGSLEDLLTRPASELGLAYNPLRIVVVDLSNPNNANERDYREGMQRSGWGHALQAWTRLGVKVERVPVMTSGEEKLRLDEILGRLQRRHQGDSQRVTHQVMVVLWTENRVALPKHGVPLLKPGNDLVIVANTARAMWPLPGLNPRPPMERYAATTGVLYDEVESSIDASGGSVRHWNELADRIIDRIRLHLRGQRITSLQSDLLSAQRVRSFVGTAGGRRWPVTVELSVASQKAMQNQALRAFERQTGREPGEALSTARRWLPAFDPVHRAKAQRSLGAALNASLPRLFQSGKEQVAMDYLAAFRQEYPRESAIAVKIEKEFDVARERQFTRMLRAGDYAAAEGRLGSVVNASRLVRLKLDLLFSRGLARTTGDQFAIGVSDLDAWYEGSQAGRQAQRTAQAADAVLTAGVKHRAKPELMARWFARGRATTPEFTSAMRTAAGRWLAAAPDLSGLLARVVQVGDLAQARAGLKATAGLSNERTAWLEFTLGNPSLWRARATREMASKLAAYRFATALGSLEAAAPVAETFAALHARVPRDAWQILAAARSNQIQLGWLERNATAEPVELSGLPFSPDFVALARRTPGITTLIARRASTNTRAGEWFELYRFLGGDQALRLKMAGGPTRAEASARFADGRARVAGLATMRFAATRDGVMMAAGLLAGGYFQLGSAINLPQFCGPGGPLFARVPPSWVDYACQTRLAAARDPQTKVVTFRGVAGPPRDGRALAKTHFQLPIKKSSTGTPRAQLGVALYRQVNTGGRVAGTLYDGTLRIGLRLKP